MKRNQTLITLIGMVALLSACGKQIQLSPQEKAQGNVNTILPYAISQSQQQESSSRNVRNRANCEGDYQACVDIVYNKFLAYQAIRSRFTQSRLIIGAAGNGQAALYDGRATQPSLNSTWTLVSTVKTGVTPSTLFGGAIALTAVGPSTVFAGAGALAGVVQGGVIKNFAFVAAFGYASANGVYTYGAVSCALNTACVAIAVPPGMI